MFKQYQNYTIRSWQPADRLAAAQVIERALAEYGLGWEPTGADRDVLAVEEYYLDRGGEFWVVEEQGDLVGTSAYYPCSNAPELDIRREKAAEIRKMYLSTKARGQGLGKYLLGQLEQAIVDRGYREIRIETASILTAAVKLYESNGYQSIAEVETSRCDRAYIKILERFAAREPLL